MDDSDRLRRLALNQIDLAAFSPDCDVVEPTLDPRTLALVRLSALAAMGGSVTASYGELVDDALDAGADVGEVIAVLFGILPVIGSSRVVPAAQCLALALGHDPEGIWGTVQ